jgi:hypothetical protein
MQGSESKIPTKNLVRQRCAEGFNSGIKGLMSAFNIANAAFLTYPCFYLTDGYQEYVSLILIETIIMIIGI